MSVTEVLDNSYVTIWYHSGSGIVHHRFKKYTFGQEFRDVLNRGFEVMKERGGSKWLSDDRNGGALLPEDADWADNDWSPRVHAVGWTHWAIVLPESVIGKMNMQKFIEQQCDSGIEVRVFTDPDLALAWLESV